MPTPIQQPAVQTAHVQANQQMQFGPNTSPVLTKKLSKKKQSNRATSRAGEVETPVPSFGLNRPNRSRLQQQPGDYLEIGDTMSGGGGGTGASASFGQGIQQQQQQQQQQLLQRPPVHFHPGSEVFGNHTAAWTTGL